MEPSNDLKIKFLRKMWLKLAIYQSDERAIALHAWGYPVSYQFICTVSILNNLSVRGCSNMQMPRIYQLTEIINKARCMFHNSLSPNSTVGHLNGLIFLLYIL